MTNQPQPLGWGCFGVQYCTTTQRTEVHPMRVIPSVDPRNRGISSRQAFAEIDARNIAKAERDARAFDITVDSIAADEADKRLTQYLNGNGDPAELELTPAELLAEHTGITDFLPPTTAHGVKGAPTWEETNDDGARIYVLGDDDGDEWHVEARITHLGQPEVQFYATISEGGSAILFRSPQAAAVFGGNILAAAIEAEQLATSWGKP